MTTVLRTICMAVLVLGVLPGVAAQDSKPKSQPKNPAGGKEKGDAKAPAKGLVYVNMKTSVGDIILELDAAKAPKSVENFLAYTRSGYYAGTIFHRVIPNFMIQGGGFVADTIESPVARPKKTQPPIQNEATNGLKNTKYSIAMARTRAPHSATSQFFINVKDNPNLDQRGANGWGYAVFGRVIHGFETVETIRTAETKPLPIMQGQKVLPDPIISIDKIEELTKDQVDKIRNAKKKNKKD